MTTINVKIKQEDKAIMFLLLEKITGSYPLIEGILQAVEYETLREVRDKLYVSRHNGKSVRFNPVQLYVFMWFITNSYSELGEYEGVNAIYILEELHRKLENKIAEINYK
jgi:hypothetical protein